MLQDSVNNSASACPSVSKWEMMEQTGEKLGKIYRSINLDFWKHHLMVIILFPKLVRAKDRLDGIVKRKLDIKLESLEDWLQLPDDYSDRKSTDDKKRVNDFHNIPLSIIYFQGKKRSSIGSLGRY